MVAQSKYYNALYHYDCSQITPTDEAKFSGEALISEFLTSRLELLTTLARDNDTQQRPNLCNPSRVVNLATLYLSSALERMACTRIALSHFDNYQFRTGRNDGRFGLRSGPPDISCSFWPLFYLASNAFQDS